MSTRIYDPDQVHISMGGAILQGYADGEFITVAQLSDGFGDVVGTDGEVSRSKSNDRRATATVKLMQTSASNLVLSGLHTVDLNSPNGAGVVPFEMADLQGNVLVHASEAWVVKYPDNSMDRTAKSREWEIRLATVTRIEGGNVL